MAYATRLPARARQDFATVVGELGLTALQARAILYLEDPVAMRDLAGHLACDASNVTGLADRLETLDAIERVPGEDRRIKLLRLTPSGELLRAELGQRMATGSKVTAKLTATERNQLATPCSTSSWPSAAQLAAALPRRA